MDSMEFHGIHGIRSLESRHNAGSVVRYRYIIIMMYGKAAVVHAVAYDDHPDKLSWCHVDSFVRRAIVSAMGRR